MKIEKDIELAQYTSWRIGGPADYFVKPENELELVESLQFAQNQKLPITILGGGSNVLISDEGVSGLVICLQKLTGCKQYKVDNAIKIEALAGTSKSELLKIFLKNQLSPALFLAGIPGDVGGGVVMNAGVSEQMHPREFGEIIEWIDVYQLDNGVWNLKRFQHNDVQWSYRHTQGWQPGVIFRVGISWPLSQEDGLLEKVKMANRIRLSRQPLDLPSCGSVFVNPPDEKAARLIDLCGLKGFRVGGAEVSQKHANFIVNIGGAKAADVKEVIIEVQNRVDAKFNIKLKTEVVWMGR